MDKLPPTVFVRCENCGRDRAEHYHANLSDGPFVGKYLLICPTVIFKSKGHDIDGIPFSDKGKRKSGHG